MSITTDSWTGIFGEKDALGLSVGSRATEERLGSELLPVVKYVLTLLLAGVFASGCFTQL